MKTTFITLILIVLLAINLSIASDQNDNLLPEDVKAFVEKRDGCDHFRGEYPYDEDRRKSLQKNMIELCTGSDKDLADLKAKYKDNSDVMKKLSTYEEGIELNN